MNFTAVKAVVSLFLSDDSKYFELIGLKVSFVKGHIYDTLSFVDHRFCERF